MELKLPFKLTLAGVADDHFVTERYLKPDISPSFSICTLCFSHKEAAKSPYTEVSTCHEWWFTIWYSVWDYFYELGKEMKKMEINEMFFDESDRLSSNMWKSLSGSLVKSGNISDDKTFLQKHHDYLWCGNYK